LVLLQFLVTKKVTYHRS